MVRPDVEMLSALVRAGDGALAMDVCRGIAEAAAREHDADTFVVLAQEHLVPLRADDLRRLAATLGPDAPAAAEHLQALGALVAPTAPGNVSLANVLIDAWRHKPHKPTAQRAAPHPLHAPVRQRTSRFSGRAKALALRAHQAWSESAAHGDLNPCLRLGYRVTDCGTLAAHALNSALRNPKSTAAWLYENIQALGANPETLSIETAFAEVPDAAGALLLLWLRTFPNHASTRNLLAPWLRATADPALVAAFLRAPRSLAQLPSIGVDWLRWLQTYSDVWEQAPQSAHQFTTSAKAHGILVGLALATAHGLTAVPLETSIAHAPSWLKTVVRLAPDQRTAFFAGVLAQPTLWERLALATRQGESATARMRTLLHALPGSAPNLAERFAVYLATFSEPEPALTCALMEGLSPVAATPLLAACSGNELKRLERHHAPLHQALAEACHNLDVGALPPLVQAFLSASHGSLVRAAHRTPLGSQPFENMCVEALRTILKQELAAHTKFARVIETLNGFGEQDRQAIAAVLCAQPDTFLWPLYALVQQTGLRGDFGVDLLNVPQLSVEVLRPVFDHLRRAGVSALHAAMGTHLWALIKQPTTRGRLKTHIAATLENLGLDAAYHVLGELGQDAAWLQRFTAMASEAWRHPNVTTPLTARLSMAVRLTTAVQHMDTGEVDLGEISVTHARAAMEVLWMSPGLLTRFDGDALGCGVGASLVRRLRPDTLHLPAAQWDTARTQKIPRTPLPAIPADAVVHLRSLYLGLPPHTVVKYALTPDGPDTAWEARLLRALAPLQLQSPLPSVLGMASEDPHASVADAMKASMSTALGLNAWEPTQGLVLAVPEGYSASLLDTPEFTRFTTASTRALHDMGRLHALGLVADEDAVETWIGQSGLCNVGALRPLDDDEAPTDAQAFESIALAATHFLTGWSHLLRVWCTAHDVDTARAASVLKSGVVTYFAAFTGHEPHQVRTFVQRIVDWDKSMSALLQLKQLPKDAFATLLDYILGFAKTTTSPDANMSDSL